VRRAVILKAVGVVALVLAFSALPTKAMAVPITGSIGFAGGIEPVANWATVNSFDITGNQAVVLCSAVTPCAGSFAVLNDPDMEIAVYNDFTLAGGVAPLWTVDGFGFNLGAITTVTRSSTGIVLGGSGTLTGGAGFDPTPAEWSFSADETGVFRFSSTTQAMQAVPDGGTTATLLGAALLGLAAVRRRFLS
jgi:hypothetical protein